MIIFTETKVGEGHYQAAKAIESVVKDHFEDQISIKIYSGMACVHPLFEAFTVAMYFFFIRYMPRLWKWIYMNNKKSTFIQKHYFAYRLKKVLEKEKPDYVVCTHASCVPALNLLKSRGRFHFKLYGICTDFGFHPYFIQPQVDSYFVAHPKMKEALVKNYQVAPDQVYDYGIPLRPEFDQLHSALNENVVLIKDKKKFHLLILGGATGYGPIEQVIQLFHPLFLLHPIQISVVTGKNKRLYRRIKRLNYSHVKLFEYVEDMKYLISQADLIITKPGGLTVTEAIACGTPMLMINPIPGHEEVNFRFLEEQELALSVRSLKEIPLIVRSMYEHAEDWERWKQRLRQEHKKESALQIIQRIASPS